LTEDEAEQRNLAEDQTEVVARLQAKLRAWQESVLESLTGADYS
jgi:hypothetical protein